MTFCREKTCPNTLEPSSKVLTLYVLTRKIVTVHITQKLEKKYVVRKISLKIVFSERLGQRQGWGKDKERVGENINNKHE